MYKFESLVEFVQLKISCKLRVQNAATLPVLTGIVLVDNPEDSLQATFVPVERFDHSVHLALDGLKHTESDKVLHRSQLISPRLPQQIIDVEEAGKEMFIFTVLERKVCQTT